MDKISKRIWGQRNKIESTDRYYISSYNLQNYSKESEMEYN